VDTTKTTTHIGLCAGYGGIELGLKRVIPNLRSVALCEIEAYACANLVAKMEAGLMDCAPIWTDLKTFPWAEFSGKVDILTGGYPCQPFSAAGKRLGTEDPRHLWPFIASGIRLLRPKLCFFENVEGHISLGLREVIGELEPMGYKVSWGIFSAREVGAPHQRKRVFIMAYLKCAGLERLYNWNSPSEQTEFVGTDSGASCQRSAWPSRPGEPQNGWEPPRVVANDHREHAGHGEQRPERTLRDLSGGCGEGRGEAMGNAAMFYGAGQARGQREAQTWRTGATQHDRQTQPSLGRDAHGTSDRMDYAELQVSCDNRTDELRLLGNGVVPATAERAFRTILEELNT
jgi:DNA (cytosine-5)-methyltransferase 1